jgi:hypothetical protein
MEMLESVVKTKTKEKLRDVIGAVRDLVLDNLLKGRFKIEEITTQYI